jgi:acetyl/propionyl-CoA carboxylase alpha subunit
LQVPLFYDPLLSKLIVWGKDRAQAIARMRRALAEYQIVGVHNTLPFARWLMEHPRFLSGDFSTDFIAEEWGSRPHGSVEEELSPEELDLAQVAALVGSLLMHEQMQEEKSRSRIITNGYEEKSRWRDAGRADILRRF